MYATYNTIFFFLCKFREKKRKLYGQSRSVDQRDKLRHGRSPHHGGVRVDRKLRGVTGLGRPQLRPVNNCSQINISFKSCDPCFNQNFKILILFNLFNYFFVQYQK